MIRYPIDENSTHSVEQAAAANVAIDIADQMMFQAIETAEVAIGGDKHERLLVVQLAAASAHTAALIYVGHRIEAALRDIPHAFSEGCTDLGASFAIAVEQFLKKPTDDNTHNG